MFSKILMLYLLCLTSCAWRGNSTHKLPFGEDYKKIYSGKLHRSCLERFGTKMEQLITEGLQTGMQCLKKLQGAGALKNHRALEDLFNGQRQTYHCNETDYHWGDIAAHASLSEANNKEEFGLFHPYISILPDYALRDSPVKGKVMYDEFLGLLFFHEQFHNIGYAHNQNEEYAYTCEDCCFNYFNMSDSHKDLSCKICSTSYKGISDPKYIRDIFKWKETAIHDGVKKSYLIRSALFESKDDTLLWPYMFGVLFEHNLVQKFLADLLIKKNITSSTPVMVKVAGMKVSEGMEDLVPLAREVAALEKVLYVDRNVKKALNGYLELDYRSLKFILRLAPKKETASYTGAMNMWNSILNDLDVIYDKSDLSDKKIRTLLDQKYMEISRMPPSVKK
jgi:hypothetical protein